MRLSLAFDAGLVRPATCVVFHPDIGFDLGGGDADIVTPHFPTFTAWSNTHNVTPDCPEKQWDMAVVCVTRSKAQTRDLIAQAAAHAQIVVVDGQKTDGIESHYKDLRKRLTVDGTLSKAHGRLFWFATTDLSDWRAPVVDIDGLRTRAGVFSADQIDPASAVLVDQLPDRMPGSVLDLGAGWGVLARAALDRGADTVDLVEADHIALTCAKAGLTTDQARFHWADARTWTGHYDWVVMNPPFHVGRTGDPGLGQAFITAAARCLKPRGTLWMVANAHLPYETTLNARFAAVERHSPNRSFKIFEAKRPKR
ncbi:MAG: methyltransferase [Pseudomonadota bacterium]